MSQVELVVYDLSQGMARQLSAQFLGAQHAIEIIPHTALVVFGREYFFGGGIQHEDPQQFRTATGMRPIQTITLGRTNVTQAHFNEWCRSAMASGRYTAASYDLLERNCNNFSHDAALEGLQLSQGVPQWILDVPQKFLSSPMGQMVRPMLQQMQVSGGTGNGGMAAPFSSTAPTSSFAATMAPTAPNPPMANPWANLSAPASSGPAATSSSRTASTSTTKAKPALPKQPQETSTLDSFCKPMLSNDTQTIPLCVKKLVAGLDNTADKEAFETISNELVSKKSPTSDQVEMACHVVVDKILPQNAATTSATPVTFVLMFLRVVLLHATDKEPSAKMCLEWICNQLQQEQDNTNTNDLLPSTAAKTMAWLTLANATTLDWWTPPPSLMETSLLSNWSVISQPRSEIRQAAAALAYNHVIASMTKQNKSAYSAYNDDDDDLSDDHVSLLCASLESIDTEPDATTRLRRVLVAARILQPRPTAKNSTPAATTTTTTNVAAKNLIKDLGFVEILQLLASASGNTTITTTGNVSDAEICQAIAQEMVSLLTN